ncbi:MAG: PEGA domain-containing protein [Myxococcota bacterium]|nr:PEGA domain-containing protein [Myxococcota bacterium]
MKCLLGPLCIAFSLGCGGGVIQRVDYATPTPRAGILHVTVVPPDAEIYIDGAYRGLIERYADGRIPVPTGRRRIKIARQGYYSWYVVLEVESALQRLKVRLVPSVHNNRYRDAGHEIQTGLE